jgi:ribosomal protein S18 acetylase RimI-like enzyme
MEQPGYNFRMTEIEVITLPSEDWQRYRAIRLEALKNEPIAFSSRYDENSRRPPEYWQGRLADAALGEQTSLLFAQVDGALVGMMGAFYDGEARMAEIISVYVSPDWRGKGVGRALMEAILAEIHKHPRIEKVTLGVNSQQSAAIALYTRFGFSIAGEVEDLMGDGKTYMAYQMEKVL